MSDPETHPTPPPPEEQTPPVPRRSALQTPFAGVLALGLAGVIFVFGVAVPWAQGAGTMRWEPVPCQILESEVVEEERREPWGMGVREFTAFEARIRYQYTYEGETHQNDTVALHASPSARNPEHAQALAAQYPEGAERTCYVNPADPSQSVLVQHQRREIYAFAGVGFILLILGLYRLFA